MLQESVIRLAGMSDHIESESVITLPKNTHPGSGSAYLFDASTGKQLDKILPSDGSADVEFGYSIAIEGGMVAVGAHKDNPNDSGPAQHIYSTHLPASDSLNSSQLTEKLWTSLVSPSALIGEHRRGHHRGDAHHREEARVGARDHSLVAAGGSKGTRVDRSGCSVRMRRQPSPTISRGCIERRDIA